MRRLGVNKIKYCLQRKAFGGMKTDQAHRMKELEWENTQLNWPVVDGNLVRPVAHGL